MSSQDGSPLHNHPLKAYIEGMLMKDLDRYWRELLDLDSYVRVDASLNGLQVGDLDGEVKKVAFAVDACAETFKRAAAMGADCLFVHHGLFWGRPAAISGGMYDRIKILIDEGVSLYASHLPLDLHDEFGNNAALARQIGLENIEPFGLFGGVKIGFKGSLAKAMNLDEILNLMGIRRDECLSVLPFGQKDIKKVAIVSGGGATEVHQAMDEEIDLYITGEVSHQIYHYCLEGGINFVAAGHYYTETYGVKEIARKLKEDTGLDTDYIDIPTGL